MGALPSADIRDMVTSGRLVAVLVLAALGVLVWRVALPAEKRAADEVAGEAATLLSRPADARLTVARLNLEQQLRVTGSYAGAVMPGGAVLARADATGFCVQVGPPGPVQHLTGPAADATDGPC
jgi:hypothetical protein